MAEPGRPQDYAFRDGGRELIPYGRQSIDKDDIEAVKRALTSDRLTTGREVKAFEDEVAEYSGSRYAVAVSNGTAALHSAMFAIGIGPGDEVIVPPITFAATSNSVLYEGGRPVFVDIRPGNLLLDPVKVEKAITKRTKAIITVDYAGHPSYYDELRAIAEKHSLWLISDACHALGAEYKGKKVGTQADLSCLSFHPVKHITTGEGGMVLSDDEELAARMARFRNHGIDRTYQQRESEETWVYDMVDLGYNYRLTDIQCALGRSQLKKMDRWLARRREIARTYDEAFGVLDDIKPLEVEPFARHAYHLYVIRLDQTKLDRTKFFRAMHAAGIGVNVHYIPVHLHPYYRKHLGTKEGLAPIAEEAYRGIITIPMFPTMTDDDISKVISTVMGVRKDIGRA